MKHCLSVLLLVSLTFSASAQDTVRVYKGWNIVGALASGLREDIVKTEPPGIITSMVYGFKPTAGYAAADTLAKGVGYWVKVSDDGVIIFDDYISCGTLTVDYGGTVYHTVHIGDQCWLRENLNIGLMIPGADTAKDNGILEKYCYGDLASSCESYGGLYQWDEAMQYSLASGARGICPPGWHIPTYEEFQTLAAAAEDSATALKELGVGSGYGVGNNKTGFSALLSGYLVFDGSFDGLDHYAYFWSSSVADTRAYFMQLPSGPGDIYFDFLKWKFGFSIRCIKD